MSIVISRVAANLSPLLFLDLFHDHALTSTAARVCSRSSKASLQVLCRVLQTYGLCRVHERPVMLGLGVPYITERVAKLFSLIKKWCLQEEASIMRLIQECSSCVCRCISRMTLHMNLRLVVCHASMHIERCCLTSRLMTLMSCSQTLLILMVSHRCRRVRAGKAVIQCILVMQDLCVDLMLFAADHVCTASYVLGVLTRSCCMRWNLR